MLTREQYSALKELRDSIYPYTSVQKLRDGRDALDELSGEYERAYERGKADAHPDINDEKLSEIPTGSESEDKISKIKSEYLVMDEYGYTDKELVDTANMLVDKVNELNALIQHKSRE